MTDNRTKKEIEAQNDALLKCIIYARASRINLEKLFIKQIEHQSELVTRKALLIQIETTTSQYESLRTHCEEYLNLSNIPEDGKDAVMANLSFANKVLQKLAEKRRGLLAQAN